MSNGGQRAQLRPEGYETGVVEMTAREFIEMIAEPDISEDEKGLKRLGLVASSIAHRLSGAEGPSPLVAKRMERAEGHELSIVSALVTLREASPEDRELVREAYQEMIEADEAEPYMMMGVLLEMVSAETDLTTSQAALEKAERRREQAYDAVLDREVQLSSRPPAVQVKERASAASLEVLEESQEILGGLASRMTRAVNPNRRERVGAWLSELRKRKEPYDEGSDFQREVINQVVGEPELFERVAGEYLDGKIEEYRAEKGKLEAEIDQARARRETGRERVVKEENMLSQARRRLESVRDGDIRGYDAIAAVVDEAGGGKLVDLADKAVDAVRGEAVKLLQGRVRELEEKVTEMRISEAEVRRVETEKEGELQEQIGEVEEEERELDQMKRAIEGQNTYESLTLSPEMKKAIWETVPPTAYAMMRVGGELEAELEQTIEELTQGKPRREFATDDRPEGMTFAEKQAEYEQRGTYWQDVAELERDSISPEEHAQWVNNVRGLIDDAYIEIEEGRSQLSERYQFLTESIAEKTGGELSWDDLTSLEISTVAVYTRDEFTQGDWGSIDPGDGINADKRALLQRLSADKTRWETLKKICQVDDILKLKLEQEESLASLDGLRARLDFEDGRDRPTDLHPDTRTAFEEALEAVDAEYGYLPTRADSLKRIREQIAEANQGTIDRLEEIKDDLFGKSVRAVVALQLEGETGEAAKARLMEEYQDLAERLGSELEEQVEQVKESFVDGEEAKEELASRREVFRAADRLTEREQSKVEELAVLVEAGQSQVRFLAAEAGVDAESIFRVAREFHVLDELAADISTEEQVRDELLFGRRLSSGTRADVEARLDRAEGYGADLAGKRRRGEGFQAELASMTAEILDMMLRAGSIISGKERAELEHLINREVSRESPYWQIVSMVMAQARGYEKGKGQRRKKTS